MNVPIAPFTSINIHIGCVPYVIREGRATMVSAFASFKFGVAFCFTQLIAVLMVFYVCISVLVINRCINIAFGKIEIWVCKKFYKLNNQRIVYAANLLLILKHIGRVVNSAEVPKNYANFKS